MVMTTYHRVDYNHRSNPLFYYWKEACLNEHRYS